MFGWIGIGPYGLPLFASLWIFLVSEKQIGARLMLYLRKTKSISLIGNNKSFKDEFETCQFRDWFEQKKE